MGCAYDYTPVRVDVRDRASHEPVAGAAVKISNTHTINPKPPVPAEGVTDLGGGVTLDVAVYNDLIIRITPPNQPAHIFSTEHPALTGPSRWFGPARTRGAALPTIEIRLQTPPSQLPEPE